MVRIAPFLLVPILLGAPLAPAKAARAQDENPVYVDDSPTAEEVLGQLPRLIAQDNLSEAVSVLQRLLDDEPARLVQDEGDPALYHSVRARVHDAILASDVLLERYRFVQEPLANRLLEEGAHQDVHRSLFLTPSGFDAGLRLASREFEKGNFALAARILIHLESHPDFKLDAERAMQAARLLAQVAPFAHDEGVRTKAVEFAQAAGLGDEITRASLAFVTPPASALVSSTGLEEPGPPFTPGQLLPRPLRSASLDEARGPTSAGASLLRGQRLAAARPEPWVMPVLAGDLVIVNDLESVSAWDRLTLERRWRFVPARDEELTTFDFAIQNSRRGVDTSAQDSASVVAHGGIVLALTHTTEGSRPSTPVLNAIDIETGEIVWSRLPAQFKGEWREAQITGTPVIEGDTAVLNLFVFSPLRRVMSAYMAGIDLYTGDVRWSTLLGTAGISPSQRISRRAHLGVADQGVIYRTDPIGIAAALQARTGEPVWIRRLAPEETYAGNYNEPWRQSAPIVLEDRVIALAPDRMTLDVYDRATGERLAQREASELGWPDYLLGVGELVVGVGAELAVLPAMEVDSAEPKMIALPVDVADGRVRAAGHRLLVPTERGVRLIDPKAPETEGRSITLDYPGAPVAVGDQLLVADGSYLHAYLPWETAERALRERMQQNRDDPDLALTYAELAYRAGVIERIPQAADAALEAIRSLAGSERAESARQRLYDSLSAMLTADLAGGGSLVSARSLSNRQRGELIERLGRAAATPDERVGYHMERGRLARLEREWKDAVSAYQDILLDDELAEARHIEGRHSQRAEIAASQAIEGIVRDHPSTYNDFDDEARDAFRALTAGESPPDPIALEQLARRYPVARITPEALLLASDLYSARGETDRAIGVLENALAAMRTLTGKRAPRDAIAGEIAGRLVSELAANERLFQASRTLGSITAERPRLELTRGGSPLDKEAFARDLAERLAGLSRRPRVGSRVSDLAQLLPGWKPAEVLSTSGPSPHDHLLLYSETKEKLALFGLHAGRDPGAEPNLEALGLEPGGPLRPIWTRDVAKDADAHLVRYEPSMAMILWGTNESAELEAIDAVTGEPLWRTPPFGTLFDNEPERRRTGLVETPLDGPTRLSDLMVTVGSRCVAIVERTGRAAIFDRVTGEIVWAEELGVPVVYEAAMDAGVLVIVGERPGAPRPGEATGARPVLAAYDVAQNRTLYVDDDLGSLPRWVRVGRSGLALVGLDGGVIAIDPKRATQLWSVDDPAVRMTGDAWMLSDRAIVMGPDRQLWQIRLATGDLRDAPLEDLSRVGEASRITLTERDTGEAVFSTDRGLMIFDTFGSLVGGDAAGGARRAVPPSMGQEFAIMLEAEGPLHPESGSIYALSVLDAENGMLVSRSNLRLLEEPESLTLIDGYIVVGADHATLVYEASPR